MKIFIYKFEVEYIDKHGKIIVKEYNNIVESRITGKGLYLTDLDGKMIGPIQNVQKVNSHFQKLIEE